MDNDQLNIKGIVYNEMRGVYQKTEGFYQRQLLKSLLRHTEYKYDSGGDPRDVIKLKFEDMCQFHSKFYHPSNCNFISYGSIDYKKNINILENEFLSRFDSKANIIHSSYTEDA